MKYILYLLMLCLLAGCSHQPSSQKVGANDPFAKTMVPSEFFTISADKDNVIEGANGTTVAMQKGCFKNKHGNIVTGEIKIELAEALSMDKMLASNLTTTSDGEQLETDGMIYLKATVNGEEVFVNKGKPLYIEIPSKNMRTGMHIYRGVRDDQGNMNWIKPKAQEVFLTAIDMDALDFLPEGFEAEVKRSMPFAGQKTATKAFTDSLYYSFSARAGSGAPAAPVSAPTQNEAYYNPKKEIKKGAYTKESYNYADSSKANDLLGDTSSPTMQMEAREIDPARSKAIKDPRFNNTLIATREFEQRLKYIFKTCNKDILEIYVNNLDKNMWKLDEMASVRLGNDPLAKQFRKFAAQGLTNVKDAPEQAALMKDYYEKQLAKNKEEIKTAYDKVQEAIAAQNKVTDSMTDAYTQLLWKREKYRMEKYKFTWTDNGWINVDTAARRVAVTGQPASITGVQYTRLEVHVDDARKYDRVHTFVIYEDIKSLYKLNAESNSAHYVGNISDKMMLMERNKKAVIITVAYKDTIPYLGIKNFITGKNELVTLGVMRSSAAEVDHAMREIEKGNYGIKTGDYTAKEGDIVISKKSDFAEENSIVVDLAYQAFFKEREDNYKKFMREEHIMDRLESIVYPCGCNSTAFAEGKKMFYSNCLSCHHLQIATTGPALAGVTSRHTRKWLYRFTRNWSDLVAEGDEYAINISNYAPSEMNRFPSLTENDCNKLYDYIECAGGSLSALSQ